jgi:hypothetical protein
MILVTLVPMFEPIIIGTASTGFSVPDATMATTVEVTVEELCTMLVARIPIKRPAIGLLVYSNSVSAKPLPKSLKAEPIRVTAVRNM